MNDFKFIDLFVGIGGIHSNCVQVTAQEISKVLTNYKQNGAPKREEDIE